MLKIETTPHLFGISLSGDYLDLNDLYDSISRYLNFYQENATAASYDNYEYLLSLNYDIRHAYMGTRGWNSQENNASALGVFAENIFETTESFKKETASVRRKFRSGNLYFQVEILYPLVFHYLAAFESILEDECSPEWFKENKKAADEDHFIVPYDEITALHDRTNIRLFVSLIWQNIASLFGAEEALLLYQYVSCQEYRSIHSIYTDALLRNILVSFQPLTEPQKKDFLRVCFYEILGSEELTQIARDLPMCKIQYRDSLAELKRSVPCFPTKKTFYQKLEKAFRGKTGIYRNDFYEFLDKQYGIVKTEEPEW